MQERMTLSNMAAELGAQAGLIAPDETTARLSEKRWRRSAGDWQRTATDPGAELLAHHVFRCGNALEPQVAAPHSPANAAPVTEAPETRGRCRLYRRLHRGEIRGSETRGRVFCVAASSARE
jgi:3-isopropylmalate/(R)-2-methylmalate dehydratase large subunit